MEEQKRKKRNRQHATSDTEDDAILPTRASGAEKIKWVSNNLVEGAGTFPRDLSLITCTLRCYSSGGEYPQYLVPGVHHHTRASDYSVPR